MKRFFCISSLIFILLSCNQNSIDKDKERINNECNNFMKAFLNSKVHDAINILRQNSVIAKPQLDTLERTIEAQVKDGFYSYGKMISYDFISEASVKDIISKRFYVLRLENYYLKFEFVLYKSSSKWTITNFQYNDDILEILKRAK